jgi:beta-mannosidase
VKRSEKPFLLAQKGENKMLKQVLNANWVMRPKDEGEFRPAQVPGSVYTDLLRNGDMEDPFFKDNEDKALLLMEKEYEYAEKFDCDPAMLSKDQILLHFYGLDTLTEITLNGTHLGSTNNMHREWEYDVTKLVKESGNELHILFHSPTKFIREAFAEAPTRGSEDAMPGFVHLRKAHCMFGWDWGAHLPDAGIYRPVELQGVTCGRIDSVHILQNHEDGVVTLDLNVACDWVKEEQEPVYTVEITAPDGKVSTVTGSPKEIRIEDPQLWWPNGYGKQNLYGVKVSLLSGEDVIDVWERRIGLRTMTMKREKDEWGESFATTVNGVSIFAMGADYIPEDHLLGRVTPETTRTLLEKAKFANHNAIRVWGGGYYPEDWFYDICDELGLVVWQDFMFACGVYDLTPEFEANIRAEFIDNVKRLRHHPSLGLWCGNNEMEMFVAYKTWISKPSETRDYILMYERIIPEILKEYDPQTFYWPASPSSGGTFDEPNDPNRGDVHYWDVWHGNKPFTEYRKFFFRYASEFGFQSFPSEKTVDTFTDDPQDKNIFSYIMEKHQRNGSANGKIMNYMQQTYKYPTNFDTVIYASQLLQADAIRYGVEHFRRNRGRCMGAIVWQLNDCWPVASWSSIDYEGRLKALHYAEKRFFAPIMISCEEEGMMSAAQPLNWLPFEFEKSIRLNVANESMENVKGTVHWQVRNADASIVREESETVEVPALTSIWLKKEMLDDIDIYNQYVAYQFEVDGKVVSEGSVLFSYPKYFHFVNPQLSFRVEGDEIVVHADSYAKSVEIRNAEDNLILSDNFFDLNAGEKRIKVHSGALEGISLRSTFDIH